MRLFLQKNLSVVLWTIALTALLAFALPKYIDFRIQRALSEINRKVPSISVPDDVANIYIRDHSAEILDGSLPKSNVSNGNLKNYIVVFTDYRCGYCRSLEKYIDENPPKGRQVVYRELPILGGESRRISKASYAASLSGKYLEFRRHMLSAVTPSFDSAQYALLKLKIRPLTDQQRIAVDKSIDETFALSKKLGISGTPAIIINGKIIRGWNQAEYSKELKAAL